MVALATELPPARIRVRPAWFLLGRVPAPPATASALAPGQESAPVQSTPGWLRRGSRRSCRRQIGRAHHPLAGQRLDQQLELRIGSGVANRIGLARRQNSLHHEHAEKCGDVGARGRRRYVRIRSGCRLRGWVS